MTGDPVFIDTNIFVYAKMTDDKEAEKHRKAVCFLGNVQEKVIISVQVINEFSTT